MAEMQLQLPIRMMTRERRAQEFLEQWGKVHKNAYDSHPDLDVFKFDSRDEAVVGSSLMSLVAAGSVFRGMGLSPTSMASWVQILSPSSYDSKLKLAADKVKDNFSNSYVDLGVLIRSDFGKHDEYRQHPNFPQAVSLARQCGYDSLDDVSGPIAIPHGAMALVIGRHGFELKINDPTQIYRLPTIFNEEYFVYSHANLNPSSGMALRGSTDIIKNKDMTLGFSAHRGPIARITRGDLMHLGSRAATLEGSNEKGRIALVA